MKVILHLLPSLNLYGGTPAKIKLLIENSKHEHYVYCPGHYECINDFLEFKLKFEEAGINVITGFYGYNLYKHTTHLYKIIKAKNISIINVYFDFEIVLAYLIKIFIPHILIVQSFVGHTKHQNFVKRKLLQLFYKQIDYCIYISDYIKGAKLAEYPVLNKKPFKIIYNSFIPKSTTFIPKENSVKTNQLITISGLNEHKNLSILIEAISILNKKFREYYTLVILGEGPLRPALETQIKSLNLQGQIKLLGFRENTYDYLVESDIYVHPADNEGFGIAVVEAMNSKKPVIISNAGGLPELIEDHLSGILVNPQDANDWALQIHSLSKDHLLKSRLIENGYQRAIHNFSVKKFVENHDSLFQMLCSK